MKQTSIDKLSKVYNCLMRDDAKALAEMIQEVLRAEAITPAKGKKFNLYNFVSDDQTRPQMCGVFHDGGYKVASDCYILVAIKDEYSEDLDGKIMMKDGSFVNEGYKYPNWRGVIPNVEERTDYHPYKVDTQKFYDWLDTKRAEEKSENGKKARKFSPMWRVQIEDTQVGAEMFAMALDAAKELETDEIWLKDSRSTAVFKSDRGTCIIMPIIEDAKEYDICKL